jgi:hypothetical protein
MRGRPSRSQQAEPEQLERPSPVGTEVAQPSGPRREDQIAFREPHRRARRRLALADLPRRSRPDAELEAETEIAVVPAEDDISSHVLVGGGAKVRVIAEGESWPVGQVKSALKEG